MKRLKISTEFDKFLKKIEDGENFALSRYGAEEVILMSNKAVDLSKINEWSFDPKNDMHQGFRNLQIQSISEDIDGYYKGVPSYCCTNENLVDQCLGLIKNKDNITLDTVFKNKNVTRVNKLLEVLNGKNIIIACDWSAVAVQNPKVKLNIRYCFRSKGNTVERVDLFNDISKFIAEHNVEDFIFLFCLGPLSNILVHQLYKVYNKNTYINIGSLFDPVFHGRLTRDYQNKDHPKSKHICVMDMPTSGGLDDYL